MHESNDLLEGNNHAIGNRHTPLEFALTLQTMGDFWTHDALDGLRVSLLFAHCLPFLFATVPPCILPSVTVRMYCPHGLKSQWLISLARRSAEKSDWR